MTSLTRRASVRSGASPAERTPDPWLSQAEAREYIPSGPDALYHAELGARVIPDMGTDVLPLFLARYDRPATRRAYRADLASVFGADSVTLARARGLTPLDINDHLEAMERTGLRPSTMRRRRAAVRAFFGWLRAYGLVSGDPANPRLLRRVPEQRSASRGVVVLTREQAAAMIAAAEARSERDAALVALLLYGCLRRSEAAAADVEDIERVGPYWRLRLMRPKSGAEEEWVKLSPQVVERLARMVSAEGITAGPLFRSHSNNQRGERLTGQSVYEIVKAVAAASGVLSVLPRTSPHKLRHTGCTLAIEAGASLKQVQTHARHRSVETTMVYLHQRDALRDSAADFIRL